MNMFDQRLITLIRQLISWLVAGDYEAAQRRSRGIRLSADLMRDADLLPAVRDAAHALLERWPQHVSPLLERWLRHGQQYGQV